MPRVVISPRNIEVKFVLTKEENSLLKKEAFIKGQSISEYIRRAVFGITEYKETQNQKETPALGE